jgi:hypothetical protein
MTIARIDSRRYKNTAFSFALSHNASSLWSKVIDSDNYHSGEQRYYGHAYDSDHFTTVYIWGRF